MGVGAWNDQLHWKLTMMGGLDRTIQHISRLRPWPRPSRIVSNGEIFGGFLGPSVGKRMGRPRGDRAFSDMNDDALKARAELLWARRKP